MTEPSVDFLTDIETTQVVYSTFWGRFWASVIDTLVLAPLTFLTNYNSGHWRSVPLFLIVSAISLLYKPLMEGRFYATVGKMAMNLTIVTTNFQQPAIRHIVLRNIFIIFYRILIGTLSVLILLDVFSLDSSFYAGPTSLSVFTILNWVMILVFFGDSIALIADPIRRAWHDRIGQTLVVKK